MCKACACGGLPSMKRNRMPNHVFLRNEAKCGPVSRQRGCEPAIVSDPADPFAQFC
jgi:hypothetical protein